MSTNSIQRQKKNEATEAKRKIITKRKHKRRWYKMTLKGKIHFWKNMYQEIPAEEMLVY